MITVVEIEIVIEFLLDCNVGLANTLLTTLQTDLFGAERVARLSALTNLFSSFTGLAAPPMAGKWR